MLLEFNVLYYAEAALKEGDGLHPTAFQKRVEVVIVEIAGEDAPVAARWPGVEIRFYEGRTFRQAFVPEKRIEGSMGRSMQARFFDFPLVHRLLGSDEVLACLKSGSQMDFLHGHYFTLSGPRKSSFPPSRYHQYEYSDADQARDQAKLDRWSRDVVVIEGEFWIACPHPVYQVSEPGAVYPTTRRHARWAGREFDPMANAGYIECAHASIFGSAQLRDAVTLSNALYGRADVIDMEVLIPEALPPLDEFERVHAVRLALEQGCGFMVRDPSKRPTPAMLRAWADLVEAADHRDLDGTAQAVERLLSELPDSVLLDGGRTTARHALDMTENREIAFDLIA